MRDPSLFAVVEPEAMAWDAFVQRHPQGSLLQLAGWGQLKSRFGWQSRRLAIAGPQGLLVGGQVLLKRRLGVAGAYVPRGPLLGGDHASDQALLAALDRLCRRNRAVFLRLEPNVLEGSAEAEHLHATLLSAGFQPVPPLQPRSSVQLDLAPPPAQLLAGMSKGHRADIKRAAREGVAVRTASGQADLDAFYAIMQATSARAEFRIHSRAYYAAAFEIFHASGQALLLLADWQGHAVAAAMICADRHAGLYLYSGSTPEGLKSGAQHAVQWQALQWAREQGSAIYDFWGVPDSFGQAATVADAEQRARLEEQAKSDPLFGVYRFKKGFGGQVVRYLPAYNKVYLPALYQLWQRFL
ncbi:MAG: peptidoglycan bridge formation glycyltransferase FemA/FemB family protein [Roseiflexaceae bacterium]|nr:peptidoglycan bridge formation glycyltransferase FemA/FemB family protein [Roseiflexaceae bacterium]